MTETALDEMANRANRANRATQGKLAIETKNRGAPPKKLSYDIITPQFWPKKRAATRAALLKAKLIEEQR
ncbi:hypothetical protein C6Y08_19445 [Lactiplantibacillus pentosus]|uniref:Prophage protein n=1 Tax=Lactiplantibacillus pentosus TaxID=1589 RepID=A0ABX5CX15_LACPE|nr:hypothetical protein C6Y08_19445 [Lactiplantibacillus pentosus]